MTTTGFAGEDIPTNDQTSVIAKLTARIELLEQRIEKLEQQNFRQPRIAVVPQHRPYHAPQCPGPRSQPYIPNANPTPNYNEPNGRLPQYVPQTPPAVPFQLQNPPNNTVPDSWKPFDFNGRRYYIIPVDEAQRINPLNQND
jgi:hypothetical protein